MVFFHASTKSYCSDQVRVAEVLCCSIKGMCKFEANHTTLPAHKHLIAHPGEVSERKISFIVGQSLTYMLFSPTIKSLSSYLSPRIHFDKIICDVSDDQFGASKVGQK